MNTRCKIRCSSVEKFRTTIWNGNEHHEDFAYTAKFQAVTADTPENKEFFASTPNLELTVRTYREDQFVPGQEYYLDFTPAP